MTAAPTQASEARRDLRGVLVNLMTLVAQASLPAFHIQLARILGGTGYGLYTWSNGLVDMLSVVTLLGMDVAVSREVSLAYASGNVPRAISVTGTALRVVLVSGLCVALTIAGGAGWVAAWQHKPGLVIPLRTLVVIPIAFHAASMFIVATQARKVMKYDFWTRGLFQPLCLLALTTAVLRLGGGLTGACAAVALGMTLTACMAAWCYSRELPLGATLRAVVRGPTDWSLVRMGAPLVATNLMWALMGRLDGLALGAWRPSVEVGAYNACVLYVMSLGQVRSAFYPGVASTVPPALARGDVAGLNTYIRQQLRWVAVLALPLFVLFAGFGDGLLSVFGREFLCAVPALAILAVGYLASSLSLPAYVLIFSGNTRFSGYAALGCLGAQCITIPLLVPRWGITGAAISASTALVLSAVFQLWFTWRRTAVHGFSWPLAKVLAAAFGGFCVGRAVFTLTPLGLAPRFFLGVGLAAVVYLALLVVLGLSTDEREIARDLVRRGRSLWRRFLGGGNP